MSIYYVHACMIPICLGTSYQVHSYLFSFFMRESFSSCIILDCESLHAWLNNLFLVYIILSCAVQLAFLLGAYAGH